MKTAIKIAALAAVLVLAAISCAPEAELTKMDWGRANDADNPTTTDSNYTSEGFYYGDPEDPEHHTYVPYIKGKGSATDDRLPVTSGGSEPTSAMELVVVFPIEADFLSKPNAQIDGELKRFMFINKYSNTTNPNNIASTVETKVDYTFQRRVVSGRSVDVIITLDNITSNMVIKIDSANYTVNRQRLDLNNDRIPAETPFDDVYITVYVNPDTTSGDFIPLGGPLNSGNYHPWVITSSGINNLTYNFDTPMAPIYLTIATIDYYKMDNGRTTDEINAIIKKELEPMIEKIQFQKYNEGAGVWEDDWENDGTFEKFIGFFTKAADNPGITNSITGITGIPTEVTPKENSIYVGFKPEEWGIYRVVATGLKHLTTIDKYWGVNQKIMFDDLDFWKDAYVSDAFIVTREYSFAGTGSGNLFLTPTAVASTSPLNVFQNKLISNVQMDTTPDGKNVVLKLFFNPVRYGTGTGSDLNYTRNEWLSSMSLSVFNKNVKLLLPEEDPDDEDWYDTWKINWSANLNSLNFLKIVNVEYSASTYYNASQVVSALNCITLTLAPNQQITGPVRLLLSPGFKYTDDRIIFGAANTPKGIYRVIDGVNRWDDYGDVPMPK